MKPNARWSAGELVPLADRLRYMFVVRGILLAAVAFSVAWAPGLLGGTPRQARLVLAAWGAATLLVEAVRRALRGRALVLFAASLMVDAAALVWLSQVGSVTNARYLIFVHMAAVVLLASYRTGLKMAVWYALLMFVAFFAGRDGAFDFSPAAPGSVARWDIGQLGVFVTAMWLVATATAVFSSVNERELRRRRFDLEALARFATALEHASSLQTVADTLLDSLADAFPLGQMLLLTAGRRPVVLAQRGLALTPGNPPLLDPFSAVLRAQLDRTTLLVSHLRPETDEWLVESMAGAENLIVIPLFAESGCQGTLVAEYSDKGNARVERRLVGILERFASHAALGLLNAALLEEMEDMATTDGLTRVANRRTFEVSLEREMARAIRSGDPLSLVMLDIDRFKNLNDTHGHQVGDEVLRQVAVALRATGREFDTIARYGGEEFAVVLPSCPPDAALSAASRIHRLVAEGVTRVPITVSVGVATFPMHAETAHDLVKAADDALYEAKGSGRDRVCVAVHAGLDAGPRLGLA